MKQTLKALLEGKPTGFFDEIKNRMNSKVDTLVESVASTVAPTVFTELDEEGQILSAKAVSGAIKEIDDKVKSDDLKNGKEDVEHDKSVKKFNAINKAIGESEEVEELEEAKTNKWKLVHVKVHLKHGEERTFRTGGYTKEHVLQKVRDQYGDKLQKIGTITPINEGKDIGKPGKHFNEIAKKAAKEYGSVEAGKRVAGAIEKKILAREEVESTNEDTPMGARTIYTKNKKTGNNVSTFVVNKKRVSKQDKQNRWTALLKKHQVDENLNEDKGDNGYICFYNGKKIEVTAQTSYSAQQIAARKMNVPAKKVHMISVKLAEKDGKPVTHSTSDI